MSRNTALLAASALAAAGASVLPPASEAQVMINQIQQETTISLNGHGSVDRAPDLATISVGVIVEGETAASAMSQQSQRMSAVFAAVKAAGVADRDMQTGSLSLNPVYDYNQSSGVPRLTGYNANNQISITVRKLDNLGKTLDAVVKAGGNTINGVSFGVSNQKEALNEARVRAVQDAVARAELYAKAAGYKVKRIISITENEYFAPPPMPIMARADVAMEAATPVAGGEVSLATSVNVYFELTK
jgi:uncharacterized protein YggE